MGAVILKDLKEHAKYRKWKQSHMDPRKSSRTPSASREPVYRLRYESALGASPSRHLDHQRPFAGDEAAEQQSQMMFDRSTSYRGSVGRSIGQAPSYNGKRACWAANYVEQQSGAAHDGHSRRLGFFEHFDLYSFVLFRFFLFCFLDFWGPPPHTQHTLFEYSHDDAGTNINHNLCTVNKKNKQNPPVTTTTTVTSMGRSYSLVPFAPEARLRLQNVDAAGHDELVDWLPQRLQFCKCTHTQKTIDYGVGRSDVEGVDFV